VCRQGNAVQIDDLAIDGQLDECRVAPFGSHVQFSRERGARGRGVFERLFFDRSSVMIQF
jgi:hypothetical protein